MKVAHNFNAGPCVLPKPAIESAIEAIRNFDNTGIGILEISHRTPGWERIMIETEQLWRDLLHISDDYAVIFLGGGASTQFYQVAANLMNQKAAYLQTGVWAKKAAKEADNNTCNCKQAACNPDDIVNRNEINRNNLINKSLCSLIEDCNCAC